MTTQPRANAAERAATEGARERSRDVVAAFMRALRSGHTADALATCTPEAVWWLPNSTDDDKPLDMTVQQLLAFIGPARSAREPVVIASLDGRTAVVEQVVQAPLSGIPTTVTSVVRLCDGRIAAGRTYADVAAWPGLEPGPQQASPARSTAR